MLSSLHPGTGSGCSRQPAQRVWGPAQPPPPPPPVTPVLQNALAPTQPSTPTLPRTTHTLPAPSSPPRAAPQVILLADYRAQLYDYLKSRMMAVAPNLTVLVGAWPAGRGGCVFGVCGRGGSGVLAEVCVRAGN